MKIERFTPQPPPYFTMTFTRDDGWAITAALKEYADAHPGAVGRETWREWAAKLDKELRHGL